ncbi:unnamed protein product [Schistosoma curassoni]|uniref:TBPIP domain-containing protein n=1 Tax=Schistosoma curassoni TaxID=6186 RepID=A0A183KUZ4_9TREM|nr:unnamed protein product [Schistosoma curassoni]
MSNNACKGDVLTFFEKENRPFSVVDVCSALKNYGKTGISRALDDLVEEGSIKEKVYGKQKVYVYDQTKLPSFDENEIRKMEAQYANLSVELTEEQKKLKSVIEELKKITSSLTKEEAEKELTQVNEKLNEIEVEVKALKAKGPGIAEADLKLLTSVTNSFCLKAYLLNTVALRGSTSNQYLSTPYQFYYIVLSQCVSDIKN